MRPSKPINYLLTITAAILLLSCGSDATSSQSDQPSELKVSYAEMPYAQPTAKLLIEGMSCERMCVSAVKKSMAEVPSVELEEMLFDADVAVDTLIVHFDPSKVTEKELVKAVEELAGGDTYHVKEIQLSKDAKTSCVKESNRSCKPSTTESRQFTFTVPNPFEVLRKVAL